MNSTAFRGPPLPHTSGKLAGRGARKKCLQNLDCRWVRGQNLDNKRVRTVVAGFASTAFASTMMNWVFLGSKVRCHRVGVEIERPGLRAAKAAAHADRPEFPG